MKEGMKEEQHNRNTLGTNEITKAMQGNNIDKQQKQKEEHKDNDNYRSCIFDTYATIFAGSGGGSSPVSVQYPPGTSDGQPELVHGSRPAWNQSSRVVWLLTFQQVLGGHKTPNEFCCPPTKTPN